MPVEGQEHDVGLDERLHAGQFAEELAGVALADGLEAVEAHGVLALEDVVEALGDHGDAFLDGGIADAEHFLDFQVGGDAEFVEVDEFLADGLDRRLRRGCR